MSNKIICCRLYLERTINCSIIIYTGNTRMHLHLPSRTTLNVETIMYQRISVLPPPLYLLLRLTATPHLVQEVVIACQALLVGQQLAGPHVRLSNKLKWLKSTKSHRPELTRVASTWRGAGPVSEDRAGAAETSLKKEPRVGSEALPGWAPSLGGNVIKGALPITLSPWVVE